MSMPIVTWKMPSNIADALADSPDLELADADSSGDLLVREVADSAPVLSARPAPASPFGAEPIAVEPIEVSDSSLLELGGSHDAYDYNVNDSGQLELTLNGKTTVVDSEVETIDFADGTWNVVNGNEGGDKNDIIIGSNSSSTMYGNGGDDVILGRGGSDTIYGGDGNDIIIGGTSYDYLHGGAGNDTFIYNDGDGDDKFYGDDGNDTIVGTGTEIVFNNHTDDATVEFITGDNVTVKGTSSSNTLDFSGTTFTGVAAIDGGAGSDIIYGTAGDDVIIGGTSYDYLHGGGGDDTFIYNDDGDGDDRFYGDDGNDTIVGTGTEIVFNNHTGDATVENVTGDNITVKGTSSSNTLDFSGTTFTGVVAIDGGAGSDIIYGTAGDDVIIGGTSYDYLHGGAGNDTFIYNDGDGDDKFYRR